MNEILFSGSSPSPLPKSHLITLLCPSTLPTTLEIHTVEVDTMLLGRRNIRFHPLSHSIHSGTRSGYWSWSSRGVSLAICRPQRPNHMCTTELGIMGIGQLHQPGSRKINMKNMIQGPPWSCGQQSPSSFREAHGPVIQVLWSVISPKRGLGK